MKLKLDENLPASVAPRLAALGHDVHTVLDESLGGKQDTVVWAAAQAEGRMLVTCDLDFSDVRTFAPGTHSGILLVRLPDEEQWRAGDHLVAWLSDPDAPSWLGCLVVATLHKRARLAGKPSNLSRRWRTPTMGAARIEPGWPAPMQ